MLRSRVDRLVLKAMPVGSAKAQMSGGKAACVSQRVEDNAFHLGKLSATNRFGCCRLARYTGANESLSRFPRAIASQGAALG